MEEIWKDVKDFPNYQVSNLGNVRNKKTGRPMHQKLGRDGHYMSEFLTNKGRENTQRVHRLVAEAFLGEHPGLVVNHIDGNKLNNNVDNLEWCTAAENNRHAIRMGLNKPGAYQQKQIRIIETGEVFDSATECAKAINGNVQNVYAAVNHINRHSAKGYHFEYIDKKEPFLRPHQRKAIENMHNGCILNGGVGSGKSRTGLYYYYSQCGGSKDPDRPMSNPKDLYIITTARKRDTMEWEGELGWFLLTTHPEIDTYYKNVVVVDSWNNIKKYADIKNAFFIFDEDKVTGYGAWVKAFLKIAKNNEWIILSATPADRWEDYMAVFIANGFYRNKTDFAREHLVYNNYSKFPMVEGYRNVGRLTRLRDSTLVSMDFERHTTSHHIDVSVTYNIQKYKDAIRTRWDPYKDEPIQQASGLCYVLRRIVNSDDSRVVALMEILEKSPRLIVFYNFNYELDMLRDLDYGPGVVVAEWNGTRHDSIPDSDSWVYLVQYTAGAEGWNCIKTDTIVFFSQNYSYKIMQQSAGRIDRLNTPYTDLWYYHLKSRSGIDLAISRALGKKKKFNESAFIKW